MVVNQARIRSASLTLMPQQLVCLVDDVLLNKRSSPSTGSTAINQGGLNARGYIYADDMQEYDISQKPLAELPEMPDGS